MLMGQRFFDSKASATRYRDERLDASWEPRQHIDGDWCLVKDH